MQTMACARSVRRGAALCALAAAMMSGQQPPQKMLVTFAEIKPEKMHEYNSVRKELSAALKKGGQSWARFWDPGVIGTGNLFVQVSPIAGFAAFDSPSAVRRALGEGEYERLMTRIRDCTVSTRREVIEPVPGLGFGESGAAESGLAMIAQVTVHPGKRHAYLDLVRQEIMPALRKAQVLNFQVYQVLMGEKGERLIAVLGLPNYGALDGGNFFERALGAEGARKLNEKSAGLVMNIDRTVARVNPEYSFGSVSATDPVSGSR
jgi:hypothetical protein